MKRFLYVLLCMIFFSCKKQSNERQLSTIDKNKIVSQDSCNSQKLILSKKLYGKWIATTVFDSTQINRKLDPSLRDMYGDALLFIDSPDSIKFEGTMDGGRVLINVLDSFTLKFEYDDPSKKFIKYFPSKDILIKVNKIDKYLTIYRRIRETDHLEIFNDEKTFNKFFINIFFADYFSTDDLAKIEYLNNGFLTYSPFNFDAFGIKDEKGEVVYYAWIFVDDVLEIYETSHTFDQDSGFAIYKIEKLNKKIPKKTAANIS